MMELQVLAYVMAIIAMLLAGQVGYSTRGQVGYVSDGAVVFGLVAFSAAFYLVSVGLQLDSAGSTSGVLVLRLMAGVTFLLGAFYGALVYHAYRVMASVADDAAQPPRFAPTIDRN